MREDSQDLPYHLRLLLNNFSNNAGANSTATLTDRKTQTFFHRNRAINVATSSRCPQA